MLELRDLDVLMEVANTGSFRGAAHALGVEPSAVSRRIRALEDRLGASLFERRRSGVSTTDAGRLFQKEVRDLLAKLDEAVRSVQEAGSAGNGRLDLGVVGSLSSRFTSRLLGSFREYHSAVVITLAEGGYHDHASAVVEGSLDAAFVLGTPSPEGFESERLWEEPVTAALPSSDPRAVAKVLSLDALSDDHFIVQREPPGPDVHDFLIRRLSGPNKHPEITTHRVGREALMLLVGLGFGTGLVCGGYADVTYPNVAFVPIEGEHVEVSALWRSGNDNPALRRFLSLARRLGREASSAGVEKTPDRSP